MANTNLTHDDVKSICDKLEVSPHAQFTDSPYGVNKLGPKNVPGHIAGERGVSMEMGKKTVKSNKVPGYKGGFAEKAKKS